MSRADLKTVRAVAGILHRPGLSHQPQLLIAKRPPGKPYAGYWEFPGGKIEANETGEEALRRELNEELGISVITTAFLFTHQHTYPDKHIDLQIWRVDEFSGHPDAKENQVLAWVDFPEIKDYQIFEGNRAFLDQLGSKLILSPTK